MGGEDQLKALIRQTFRLQNVADKAVVNVDQVLAQVMANVKRLVETMPKEGLLREKAWRDLEPLVKDELSKYGDQLGKSLVDAEVNATPAMRKYGLREFNHAGAGLPQAVATQAVPVADSIRMALNSKVAGTTVEKLFALNPKVNPNNRSLAFGRRLKEAKINKALFKTVNTRVRGGLINGWPTQEIANLMATDVVAAGVPGVSLTAPVAKQIRSQAMAIARTATQDMQRQVKEQLYEENKSQLKGMVWMWSTALDSKTCETCAPLDQKRWEQGEKRPDWPIHPNCRCEALLIDPEDEFWNETERTVQQIRPVEKGEYKGDGAYKTPIKVKGRKYYRKAVTVTSDRPPTRLADVYASWATSDHNASLVAALGPTRARYFYRQFNEFNRDPEQILNAMLTGKPGAQKWIPVERLQKKLPSQRPPVQSLTIDLRGDGTDHVVELRDFSKVKYDIRTPLQSYKTQILDGMLTMQARDSRLIGKLLDKSDKFTSAFKTSIQSINTLDKATNPKTIALAKQRFIDASAELSKVLKDGTEVASEYRKQLLSRIPRKTVEQQVKRIEIVGGTMAQQATARQAIREFTQMFNGNGIGGVRKIKLDKLTDGGEFDLGSGLIRVGLQDLGKKDLKNLIFHEMGHSLEYLLDGVKDNAVAWRNSRATSKKPGRLGFGRFSFYHYVKDKFFDDYVGRIYNWNSANDATEVISTGAEMFARPDTMLELLSRDPEHFFLINSLTRQRYQR